MKNSVSLLLAAASLGGCGFVCENEISQSVASPSGAMKAVMFHRNCGATVGFNTQVSILPSNRRLPDDGGNVLIMDGSIALAITWESESGLKISGVKDARIFRQETSFDGVRIVYPSEGLHQSIISSGPATR